MSSKDGITGLALGRKDILRIAPEHLQIKEGWNCRDVNFDPEDPEDLALAKSIASVGVKQPLTAIWEKGQAVLTDGHRRLSAALWAMQNLGAEIKSIPVQTEDRYASEEDRVLSQIVRNNGKELSPIETGRVYKRLFDLGWTEAQIAEKVGRSPTWVRNLLELSSTPKEVTDLVKAGTISASLAIDALHKAAGDSAAAAQALGEAVERAKAEGKTRATAQHTARGPTPGARIKELAELVDTLNSSGRIVDSVEIVELRMTSEEYDRFLSLLKVRG